MTEQGTDQQPQESKELNNATAEAASGLSVFDEQEVDYVILDRCLSKLLVMMDQPWPGKEKIPPVKLNREHVDFLMKEGLLSKIEAEGLLTRSKGDLKAAVDLFLSEPLNRSFKVQ